MKKTSILFSIILFALLCNNCSTDDYVPLRKDIYFPPTTGISWETTTPSELNWDTTRMADLYSFLSTNKTRAFIVLKKGKIVVEKYWGRNILDNADFSKDDSWYWASAGKTITSFLIGKAQEDGLIALEDKTSKHLGEHWTSLELEDENFIKIRHQLSMTTGLDYDSVDLDCTDSLCLRYKKRAGTQWYYHNAPNTLLSKVLENASGKDYNAYTKEKLMDDIGMSGKWIKNGYLNVFWSKPRDAARFGLLIMNEGRWENTSIMRDNTYLDAMINTSQNINKSYGYLWWLNGKESVVFPGSTTKISSSISPNAPDDLVAAMGKNGQFIDVIPSEDLVVIRMGEAPDNALVPVLFHDEMWKKLKAIRNK